MLSQVVDNTLLQLYLLSLSHSPQFKGPRVNDRRTSILLFLSLCCFRLRRGGLQLLDRLVNGSQSGSGVVHDVEDVSNRQVEYDQADHFGSLSGVDHVGVGEDHVPEVLSLCLLISELFQIGQLNLLRDSCGSRHGWGRWHGHRWCGH